MSVGGNPPARLKSPRPIFLSYDTSRALKNGRGTRAVASRMVPDNESEYEQRSARRMATGANDVHSERTGEVDVDVQSPVS